MTRFEKGSVWITTLLVALTGIGYGWTKYLTTSTDPFSVINHPLQPVFLKLHILVAPLLLFAIGMVALRHIWRHFRSGTRRSRKSGLTTAAALVPMVGTGYAIQVISGESWLTVMIVAHIAAGLLYLVGILLHQWFLRRSATARAGSRAAAETVPSGSGAVAETALRTRTARSSGGHSAPRPTARSRPADANTTQGHPV